MKNIILFLLIILLADPISIYANKNSTQSTQFDTKIQQCYYEFMPQQDITLYELAMSSKCESGSDHYTLTIHLPSGYDFDCVDNLSENIKRHFILICIDEIK